MREQVGGKFIVLKEGSRHRYNRDAVGIQLFIHASECMRADYDGRLRPDVPEVLQMMTRARNRRAAVAQLYPEWSTKPPLCAVDLVALVDDGELAAKPFAPDYAPVAGEGV